MFFIDIYIFVPILVRHKTYSDKRIVTSFSQKLKGDPRIQLP